MATLGSHLFRLITIFALVVSATAMSWAQTPDDGSHLQLHKGHQVSAEAVSSISDDNIKQLQTERHHDTLCASACALVGALSEPVSLDCRLSLVLKLVRFPDLGKTSFDPEPGQRPPKLNPIVV